MIRNLVIGLLLVATPGFALANDLLSAVLPSSRSVEVGTSATAFAILINISGENKTGCRIELSSAVNGTFRFFAASPSNQVTGSANERVDIPAGGSQNFLFEIIANAPISPANLPLRFTCDNAQPAPAFEGVNSFLFSSSSTAGPDILAIGAVISGDGITNVPGTLSTSPGVMSVASLNLGATSSITVVPNVTGTNSATASICQTNLATGACLEPPSSSVSLSMSGGGGTPYAFSVFVTADETVTFAPQSTRVAVQFRDAENQIRGATSTALRTRNLITADDDNDGLWDDVEEDSQEVFTRLGQNPTTGKPLLDPLLLSTQKMLLFSELDDLVYDNIQDFTGLIDCLYLTRSEAEAARIARTVDLAILNNSDRSGASETVDKQLSGAVFSESGNTPDTCQ